MTSPDRPGSRLSRWRDWKALFGISEPSWPGVFAGSHQKAKASGASSSSEEDDLQMTSGPLRAKPPSQNSAPAQKTSGRRAPAARSRSVSVEMEEQDQDELDPYQNWSAHSAEIAK